MKQLRMLVTCLGFTDRTFFIQELHRVAMVKTALRIYGADMNPQVYVPLGLERVFPLPPAMNDEFLPAMEELIEEHRFDAVISGLELECYKFAELATKYPHIRFTSFDDPALLSKGRVYDKVSLDAERNGPGPVKAPEHQMFYLRESVDIELWAEQALTQWGRFVSRPIGRFAADGFWVVEGYEHEAAWLTGRVDRRVSYDAWRRWLRTREITHPSEEILLSAFVERPSYSVDVFSWRGEVTLCAPHRRVGREWNFVDAAVVEPHPHILEIARYLSRLFSLDGPWNFEVNENEGDWALIEINARLSDTATTTNLATGGQLAESLVRDALGYSVPPLRPHEPLTYCMRPAIFRM